MGAGALIRDPDGHILLVESTYKSLWEIPGGVVEQNESPREACTREVTEELGLHLKLGRLLCWEWQGPQADRDESLMFLYDGGVLDPSQVATVVLASDELASFRFLEVEDCHQLLPPRLARRLKFACAALADGVCVELVDGIAVGESGTAHRRA